MSETIGVNESRRAFLGLRPPAKADAPRAVIAATCLNLQGVICDACKDTCSSRAIQRVWTSSRIPALTVSTELCTGCGDCVGVCPNNAISMTPVGPVHE